MSSLASMIRPSSAPPKGDGDWGIPKFPIAESAAYSEIGWIEARAWRSLQGNETIRGLLTMRASRVLKKCLTRSLEPMHDARSSVLLRSVEALVAGGRLTLMDIARA